MKLIIIMLFFLIFGGLSGVSSILSTTLEVTKFSLKELNGLSILVTGNTIWFIIIISILASIITYYVVKEIGISKDGAISRGIYETVKNIIEFLSNFFCKK